MEKHGRNKKRIFSSRRRVTGPKKAPVSASSALAALAKEGRVTAEDLKACGLSVADLVRPKAPTTRRGKYNNERVETEDGVFDSKLERRRFATLKLRQRAGEITELRRQVDFEIEPANDLFRPVNYRADFTYRLPDGTLVVEDAKGDRTDVYILKRKLLYARTGILIQEV